MGAGLNSGKSNPRSAVSTHTGATVPVSVSASSPASSRLLVEWMPGSANDCVFFLMEGYCLRMAVRYLDVLD